MRWAMAPAPNPLSMLTTATPGAQEFRRSGQLWSEIARGGDYEELAEKVDEARSIEERAVRQLMN